MITEQTISNLHTKTEQLYTKNKKLFFFNYISLIVTTYAYITFLIIFSIACLAGGIALLVYRPSYLFVFITSIGVYTLTDLWKTYFRKKGPSAPEFEIDRRKYTEFDVTLKKIEESLEVKVDRIFATLETNANVTSKRVFPFKIKNELRIGLPLLMTADIEEMKWILAHELGHISRKHGVISSWSYKTYHRLLDLFGRTGQRGQTSFLIKPFFIYIWPRVAAYQFALSRNFEFDVDNDATRLYGKDSGAKALLHLSYYAESISDMTSEISKGLIRESATPPVDIYARIQKAAPTIAYNKEKVLELFEQRKLVVPSLFDTHPQIQYRIAKILGIEPSEISSEQLEKLLYSNKVKSFEALFNDPGMIAGVSDIYRKAITEWWEQTHARYQELQTKEAEYAKTAKIEDLAYIVSERYNLEGFNHALPYLEKLETIEKDHTLAISLRFYKAIADKETESAEKYGSLLMEKAPTQGSYVLQNLYYLYKELKNEDKIAEIDEKGKRFTEEYDAFLKKLNSFTKKDILIKAETTPEIREVITKAVSKFPIIKAVYIAEKEVGAFGFKNVPIIVIEAFRYTFNREKKLNDAIARLTFLDKTGLPEKYLANASIFKTYGITNWVLRRIKGVESSKVYRSERVFTAESKATAVALIALFSWVFYIVNYSPTYERLPAEQNQLSYHKESNTYTYTDIATGATIEIPGKKSNWIKGITTFTNNPRGAWKAFIFYKELNNDDLKIVGSKPIPFDAEAAQRNGKLFITVKYQRYTYLDQTSLEYIKYNPKEEERVFHNQLVEEYKADVAVTRTKKTEQIDFNGNPALKTTFEYFEIATGSQYERTIISFLKGNKTHFILYVFPKMLEEKYREEVEKIAYSLRINE